MPGLLESIKEDEKLVQQLNQEEGDDNERSEPDETEGSKRGSSTEHETETGDEGATRVRGRDGRSDEPRGSGRRAARGDVKRDAQASGETSQEGKGSASEDSEASRGAGGSSSRPGGSPRGDAGRVDGRGKADDGRVEGDLEDKAEAPVDHAGAARLRRELREAKARLKELEESRAAPATTTTTPEKKADAEVVSDPEPNKAANPQAWNEWRIRALEKTITDKIAPIEKTYQVTEEQRVANERISGAVNEFKQIRDEYIQKNPDFVPAFTHGYNKVTEAYALMNPSWSKERIVKEADWQMLQFASDCARKGINPAEALYDLSIERFGYKPGQAKAAKETRAQPRAQEAQDDAEPAPQREKPRADLRTIDRNRKRSVTPLARGGQSGSSRLTKESVANMTNGELLNLDPADWDALERLEG